jgi:hypothetical protein
MASVTLEIGQQYCMSGAGDPYTVTFPTGNPAIADPTGVRNISAGPLVISLAAAVGEFFWLSDSQTQVAAPTFTVRSGDSLLLVYRETKGWVPFIPVEAVSSRYVLTAPVAPIAGGVTADLPISPYGPGNPTTDFTIVGGNTIQANRLMKVTADVFSEYDFDGSGNEELSMSIQIIPVIGLATFVTVAHRDAFQTSRTGSWLRTTSLPVGIMEMAVGDQFLIRLENNVGSTLDVGVLGLLMILSPS